MKLIATLMICSFSLGVFPPVLAGGEDIDLTIGGNFLSARLKEIPLKIILEKLKREKGVWFRGDLNLLEEEITVQFTDLPFEEGLKRILASINFSLMFDGNERLVGVIVLGKGTPGHGVSEGRDGAKKRTISPPGTKEQVLVNDPFPVIRSSPPSGGYVEVTSEDREDFTVIRNSPLPGGPVKVTEEELENFTVIRESPPPGGPVEVTEQERDNFAVIRSSPPPGGPVEVTAEELQKFTPIRNCPPPGS